MLNLCLMLTGDGYMQCDKIVCIECMIVECMNMYVKIERNQWYYQKSF